MASTVKMSDGISTHFNLKEFQCHDGTPYPSNWIESRLKPLCAVLEAVRAACGNRPVTVVSGYRTPSHNASLREADGSGTGVAKNSQHVAGRAADISVEGLAPLAVHKTIRALLAAKKIEIGGLGLYTGWVHIDIRDRAPNGRIAQWAGQGVPFSAIT